jgi:hypothetical protein
MSSGLVPVDPPSAKAYLAQKAQRLRLAINEIRLEFQRIEVRTKEVQHDLILVISALDQLEDESRTEAKEPLP